MSGSERRCVVSIPRCFADAVSQAYLEKELGAGTIDLMRKIKETIDPQNIMVRRFRTLTREVLIPLRFQNPGKLVPELGTGCGHGH